MVKLNKEKNPCFAIRLDGCDKEDYNPCLARRPDAFDKIKGRSRREPCLARRLDALDDAEKDDDPGKKQTKSQLPLDHKGVLPNPTRHVQHLSSVHHTTFIHISLTTTIFLLN